MATTDLESNQPAKLVESTEIPAGRNSCEAGALPRLINSNRIKNCPLCPNFSALSLQTVISHIRIVHSNDPRFKFTCGLAGCAATTYKSFSALYSHLYRHHSWLIKKRKGGVTPDSEFEISEAGDSEAAGDPIFIDTTPCSTSGSEDTGGSNLYI